MIVLFYLINFKSFFSRINFPLDYDLAVNEDFHCPTKEDSKSKNHVNYRNHTDSVLTVPILLILYMF